MTAVKDALCMLDQMHREVSDFEAAVLETLTRQVQSGRLPSAKQHRILCEMVEKYLHDPTLLRTLLESSSINDLLQRKEV